MSRSVNVVAILGSPRAPSYTRSLAVAVIRALEARGAAVETLDLRATPLPPMSPELRAKRCEHPDPEAARLFRLAETADAYLLASPVYHNSYSGVLKNALDYLMLRDLRDRPVALASHGGRSTQAVDPLRIAVRGLLGVAIPAQICTAVSDFSPEPDADGLYAVTDADIQARIARQADELLLFAKHLGALRAEKAALRQTGSG
ncbi:MAG: NADPH-dependent FMN reductase [Alphaproteobacteria bacterium]